MHKDSGRQWFWGTAYRKVGTAWVERTVSRKGVKACVVLERGAMFKFPDDSRKRYFNALDRLPSNVLDEFSQWPSRAPHDSHSRLQEGAAGTTRTEAVQTDHCVAELPRNHLFSDAFCERGVVSTHILERALEGQCSDMQQVVFHGEQPYCICTARNLGHMRIKYKLSSVCRVWSPQDEASLRLASRMDAWLVGCAVCLPRCGFSSGKSVKLTLPGWQRPVTWWCTLSCKIKWTRL